MANWRVGACWLAPAHRYWGRLGDPRFYGVGCWWFHVYAAPKELL